MISGHQRRAKLEHCAITLGILGLALSASPTEARQTGSASSVGQGHRRK